MIDGHDYVFQVVMICFSYGIADFCVAFDSFSAGNTMD